MDGQRSVVRSPFGAVSLVWRIDGASPRLVRVLLPGDGECAADPAGRLHDTDDGYSHPAAREIGAAVLGLMRGEAADFDRSILSFDGCSEFQRSVYRALDEIPRGTVITYAALAARIGRPACARAVGSANARNPFPVLLPCHRVIGSDFTLRGYRGGLAMKRALLEREGVAFTPSGRVAL